MVFEILSTTGRTFCDFGPFFALYPTPHPLTAQKFKVLKWKNHLEILSLCICAPWITIIWWMVPEICSVRDNFFIILSYFLPFYLPNSPKNQILKKWRKRLGISSFYICTKNYDQMMYGFWDMVHDRCNCYFSFWAIFCHFTSLTAQKIKI